MPDKTYAGAVATSVVRGLFAAIWAGSRGLPPGRRRAVRIGAAAAAAAIAVTQTARAQAAARPEHSAPVGRERSDESAMVVSRDPEVAARMTAEMRPILPAAELGRAVREPVIGAAQRYRRHPVLGGAALIYSVVMGIGGRRLEKRWLVGLVRDGHPHPHRGLAIRIGLLTAAGSLPSTVLDVREARSGR